MKVPEPYSSSLLPSSVKVAIVHDWLIGGGAELVVEALHKMYPNAPIYTSYCTDEWRKRLNNKVVTGYLQRWPFPKMRKFIPFLRGWWFARLNLSAYDLVISSSGAEAKFILPKNRPLTSSSLLPSSTSAKRSLGASQTRTMQGNGEKRSESYHTYDERVSEPMTLQSSISSSSVTGYGSGQATAVRSGPRHIAYVHAPTHYYWARYEDYLKSPGTGAFKWLSRLGLRILVGPMRRWDFRAAQRTDLIIANSNFTAEQIKKYYRRESIVVHPPVDVERFAKYSAQKRSGFVITGRQTPYKRIDLAVAACTKLNLPLTVIGKGPEHNRLVAMAGPTIKFISRASDEELAKVVGSSEGFIFPGIDDFGIAAVEALAAGTPVIAFRAGGALDYVNEKTGSFFDEQTVDSLCKVLEIFAGQKFNQKTIMKSAENFSEQNFINNILTILR
jgi:glycosyltransferase involved in cell wall biosynthesis